MSIFDFPRIHFAGRLRLNPGTANNEDYAQPGPGQALIPEGPHQGEPMGLLATSAVRVRAFGMRDAQFVEWVQRAQPFTSSSGGTESIVPAEWNYYGDMSAIAVDVRVTGVQAEPGHVLAQPDPQMPLTEVLGASLDWTGTITDINPEGDPPATQFFVDGVRLTGRGKPLLTGGRTSKGVGLWINFFRNVDLVADDGSGTYLHHVIRGCDVAIPGFDEADGVVMRYTLSLPLLDDPSTKRTPVLEQYYRDRRANPKTLDLVGSLAPYYDGEPIAMPPGRQLISRRTNISTPSPKNNGGGNIALAPAVAAQHGDWLTIDLAGTFPEAYGGQGRENPKYDFGPVSLYVASGDDRASIGPVPYADTDAGNRCGWLFDLDVRQAADDRAARLLADDAFTLELRRDRDDCPDPVVSREVDYYVVTDQLAVYAEQGGPDDEFLSQGVLEPLSVAVYHRGRRLDHASCPPISMWQYRTTPIQSPGDAVVRTTNLRPGEPITVATDQSGAFLLTFRVDGERNPPASEFPPPSYAAFAYPPQFAITWAPQISIRVLPNQDYSQYFEDPTDHEPVGNELLTWDVVYQEVLRTYALLYPAMSNKIRLDDPVAMTEFASYVIDATRPERWMSSRYMPPTRDLSASRRKLLQAWCRKVRRDADDD